MILQAVVLELKKMPLEARAGFMKLKMMLLLMMLPLFSWEALPSEYTALTGLPAASAVMVFWSMVLLSFPLPAGAVEKKTIPPAVASSDPFI